MEDIEKQIVRVFKEINQNAKKAYKAAMRRSANSTIGFAVKRISRDYNIKQKTLREYQAADENGNAKPAKRIRIGELRISNAGASVTVVGKRRAINLVEFNAKQTKKGVTYRLKRNEGRQTLVGAFIPRSKDQKVWGKQLAGGVHIRTKNGSAPFEKFKRGNVTVFGKGRFPVKVVYGIDLVDLLQSSEYRAEMLAHFNRRYPIDLQSQLDRFTGTVQ